MELSLRDLQRISESIYSIDYTRKQLNKIVEYFKSVDYYEDALRLILHDIRHLSIDICKEADVFFINADTTLSDIPTEFQEEPLGIVRHGYIVYAGMVVYPVKDVHGDVMGFCGWEEDGKPKYLDSKNDGYKAKATTLFGMENLSKYYASNEPVFITEGIVCSLYLRSKHFQSLALLGSTMSPYVMTILSRFGNRAIFVADNDAFRKDYNEMDSLAGEHLVKQVKRFLPMAMVIQSTVAKDIDDSRLINDCVYEDTLLQELRSLSPLGVYECIRIR